MGEEPGLGPAGSTRPSLQRGAAEQAATEAQLAGERGGDAGLASPAPVDCSEVSVWQSVRYPPTKTSQSPADSRRGSQQVQTRRQRPPTPMKSSALFVDGVYVQMQTSAKGRARKVVPGGLSTSLRLPSSQGRWIQGRYKALQEGGQAPPSGTGRFTSKLFSSANTAVNRPPSRKRPSGNPNVRYAPTHVHQIPVHLGGSAIRRLKLQRPAVFQKSVSQKASGRSLRKGGGRWM